VRPSLLAAAVIACSAAPALGQGSPTLQGRPTSLIAPAFDPTTLDPSVALVISGGRWDTGAERGTHRVLLLRDPANAARRQLVVQWIEEQSWPKRLLVRASSYADAIPDGVWVLAVPRLELRNGRWFVVIAGTTDAGRIRRTWRFDVAEPGKLREVQLH
jgi:hypothetical protein